MTTKQQTHSFSYTDPSDGKQGAQSFGAKGTAVMTRNALIAKGYQCDEIVSVDKPIDPEVEAKLAALAEITGGGPASLQDIADAGLLVHSGGARFGATAPLSEPEAEQAVEQFKEKYPSFPAIKADVTWQQIADGAVVATGDRVFFDEVCEPLTDEQVDRLVDATFAPSSEALDPNWIENNGIDVAKLDFGSEDVVAVVNPEPLPTGVVELRKYANRLRKEGLLGDITSTALYSLTKAEIVALIRQHNA